MLSEYNGWALRGGLSVLFLNTVSQNNIRQGHSDQDGLGQIQDNLTAMSKDRQKQEYCQDHKMTN